MRRMPVSKLLTIWIILGIFYYPTASHAQKTYSRSAIDFLPIDAYINSQMTTYRIPGLALAIIKGDQIVYMQGYGKANPAGDPVTPQTSFIIGSTGKSITASAMMMLVDEGKVDLDAPVQRYLSWFRLADAQASAQISVRMLLNQTSGILSDAGSASQAFSDLSTDALEEQVRSFDTIELRHKPGSAYEYANANYQIAGMIIQAVSGQSFQDFIKERIYAPLEMGNSYVALEEARQHDMATGYRLWFGFPIPAYHLPYSYRQFPAGWYICSVEDLAHYLIMHMNDGRYKDKLLISPSGMADLHRPVLGNYAMGWVVEGGIISHNGGVPNYGSGLYFDPSSHYGVVVAFNANQGEFYSPAFVIAPSVLQMLNGGRPFLPVPDAWHNIMIPALGITLSIQTVWIILSAWVLARWREDQSTKPRRLAIKAIWLLLPLIIEFGLAFYIISSFQSKGGTVFTAFIYQPDIVSMALTSFAIAIGWGAARTIMSLYILFRQRV